MSVVTNQLPAYKNLIEELECTDAGKNILKNAPAQVGGRDRQFLLLLMNNDYISKQACLRIISKVSLSDMFKMGLIKRKDGHKNLFDGFVSGHNQQEQTPKHEAIDELHTIQSANDKQAAKDKPSIAKQSISEVSAPTLSDVSEEPIVETNNQIETNSYIEPTPEIQVAANTFW